MLDFVAVDLETSGLDSKKDAIIEVGAAKLRFDPAAAERADTGITVVEQFQQLIRPREPISFFIEKITGITNEMLEEAPDWDQVKDEVGHFIGELPIVGHSVGFDTSFLQDHGLPLEHQVTYDTYVLGTMLVREAPSHNLGRLSDYLGLSFQGQHRALEDAIASGQLFGKLLLKLAETDSLTAQYIRSLIAQREYSYGELFNLILPRQGKVNLEQALTSAFSQHDSTGEQDDTIDASNIPDVDQVLAADGPLADLMTGYQPRAGQQLMAQKVAAAFDREDNLVVEAGTGVGKSIGYLLPAALQAFRLGQPVIVATDTLHLQDQLCEKELPLLQKALATFGLSLQFSLLKGRDQYLCWRRFQHLMRQPRLSEKEIHFLIKILLWLPHTKRGEKQEIAFRKDEYSLWRQVSSAHVRGGRALCSTPDFVSFYDRAWQQARESQIVVTNQAFLGLSRELQSDEFPIIVIDEAHHLEDTFTRQNTVELDEVGFRDWLSQFGKKEKGSWTGIFQELDQWDGKAKLGQSATIASLAEQVQELFRVSKHFFPMFKQRLQRGEPGGDERMAGAYHTRLRLTPQEREQDYWLSIEKMADQLDSLLGKMSQYLSAYHQQLKEWPVADKKVAERRDDVLDTITGRVEEIKHFRRVLEETVMGWEAQKSIAFLKLEPSSTSVALCSAPMRVDTLVQQQLLAGKKSLVLASATLQTNESFDYVLSQLGLQEQAELAEIASPFDYPKQAKLYVPEGLPEPHGKAHVGAIAKEVLKLASHFQGRMLVLFTSHQLLKEVHGRLEKPLDELNIELLSQGVTGSRKRVIMRFQEENRSVMLGTSSFWEGVDFPGDQLQCVVITKLPFDVPSTPEFAARGEQYDDPFFEYAIPRAILRFRQGFGRLIRTAKDCGVVAILDKRVTSKRYGQKFLDSLPEGMERVTTVK